LDNFQSMESGKALLKDYYPKRKKMETPIYEALKRRNQKRKEKHIMDVPQDAL